VEITKACVTIKSVVNGTDQYGTQLFNIVIVLHSLVAVVINNAVSVSWPDGGEGEFATLRFVASWIIGSLGHPRARERERQYTVAKVTSTSPTLDCYKGLIFWGDSRGVRGWEVSPCNIQLLVFQKPVAGEQSPTSFHLNPLYPGHATRSTQLTTGPSPWLRQFPPSIPTLAGYQPVMLHLVLLMFIAAFKEPLY